MNRRRDAELHAIARLAQLSLLGVGMRRRSGFAVASAVALVTTSATASTDLDGASGARAYCALFTEGRYAATTRSCLGCHDGSVGVAIQMGGGVPGQVGHSHPVGVDYASAARRQPGRYRERRQLPLSLLLPEGAVTCVTCHDASSVQRNAVVIPLSRSELCFTCHVI